MSEKQIVCDGCGSINRLRAGLRPAAARCGRCGEGLFSGHARDVSAEIFATEIERSSIPVLIDVWAPRTDHGAATTPVLDAAARELEPAVRLIRLNADGQSAVLTRLGAVGLPTMVLFHCGEEVDRISGSMTCGQIVNWVRELLLAVSLH